MHIHVQLFHPIKSTPTLSHFLPQPKNAKAQQRRSAAGRRVRGLQAPEEEVPRHVPAGAVLPGRPEPGIPSGPQGVWSQQRDQNGEERERRRPEKGCGFSNMGSRVQAKRPRFGALWRIQKGFGRA